MGIQTVSRARQVRRDERLRGLLLEVRGTKPYNTVKRVTEAQARLAMNRDYFNKLWVITGAEWQLRQQSTFWGFLWTLLNPALIFTALYVLFVKWLGRFQSDYAVFLIIGIIEWNYFASATSYSLSSLPRRSTLLKNYPLPPEMMVLASIATSAFSHYLELAALAAFCLLFFGGVHAAWLMILPLEVAMLALICGVSFFLSVLYVSYFDTERVWSVILTAGFFLTPVFYPLSIIGPEKQWLPAVNPLTHAIEALRGILMPGYAAHPGTDILLLACAGALVSAMGGIFIRRRASRVANNL